MNYVYSTLTCSNLYVDYEKSQHLNVKIGQVLIKGGANVATEGMRSPITPHGAVTEVNDDELEMLERNYHFKEHVKLGFLKVDRAKISFDKAERNVEKTVSDMSKKDGGSPKTKKEIETMDVKEYQKGA